MGVLWTSSALDPSEQALHPRPPWVHYYSRVFPHIHYSGGYFRKPSGDFLRLQKQETSERRVSCARELAQVGHIYFTLTAKMFAFKAWYKDKPNINADRQNQKGERVSLLDLRARLFPEIAGVVVEDLYTTVSPLTLNISRINLKLHFKF